MAFTGLKYAVFAPITDETSSAPTYGTGFVVGKMISANIAVTTANAVLYADDIAVEEENGFVSGTISLNVDDLSEEVAVGLLGSQLVGEEGDQAVQDAATYSAPDGGFGYLRIRRKNGVRSIRAIWLYKTKFAMPSDDATTKGETVEFQTPTMEGSIKALDTATQEWRVWKDFTTEAEAVAWINEKANITAA